MTLPKILEIIGTILTLGMSAFLLWKARQILPKEVAAQDANASKTYAEAAKLAADQLTEAFRRIRELEERGDGLDQRIDELQSVVVKRDKCIDTLNAEIKRRDALIKEWADGIKILMEQLIAARVTPAWTPKPTDFPAYE